MIIILFFLLLLFVLDKDCQVLAYQLQKRGFVGYLFVFAFYDICLIPF